MPQAQGALGTTLAQREASFNTAASAVKSKKVYFTRNEIKFSQNMVTSPTIRGGSRHPTQASRGTTDITGPVAAELQSNIFAWYAALGSISTAQTGGTMGTDIAPTAATIDATNCTMTFTKTAHGLAVGDTVEIAGLTAPTNLNSKVFAVFHCADADHFTIAIPAATGTTYTKGSGTVKKVTTPGTVFTHTMIAGGGLPSYIIERGFSDIAQYFKYTGCMCGGFNFQVGTSGIIEVTYDWMGGAEVVGSSSFETGTATDNGKRIFDCFSLAAADTKIGGSAVNDLRSVQFQFSNELDGDTFVVGGQGGRSSINANIYKITGSVTAIFDTITLYNLAKNQTESSIDLTFKRDDGSGADNKESLQILVPELTFTATAPPISGGKGVEYTLNFEGFYDNAAAGAALQIILKNAITPGLLI